MAKQKRVPETRVQVVQTPGEEISVDVLAKSIEEISDGVKKLRAGRLNDKALIFLVHKASGVRTETVRAVMAGMENLSKEFLR